MARPRQSEDKIQAFIVRLPADLHERLKARAAVETRRRAGRVSANDIVREALTAYLKKSRAR